MTSSNSDAEYLREAELVGDSESSLSDYKRETTAKLQSMLQFYPSYPGATTSRSEENELSNSNKREEIY